MKPLALLLVGFTLTALLSCRRNLPACEGNCVNISVNGTIYNRSDGSPLENIPVKATFNQKGYCITCRTYDIATRETDANGHFSFNFTIDTTYFNKNYLLILPNAEPNQIPDIASSLGVRMDRFDATGLQNLVFGYYPETKLTLHIDRTQNDNFEYFYVSHTIQDAMTYIDFSVSGQQNATSITKAVPTASGTYTKIHWRKTVNGVAQEFVDSIFCTPMGPNIFEINY